MKGGFIDEYSSKDGMAHGLHRYIINGKCQIILCREGVEIARIDFD